MLDTKLLETIKQASVAERIKLIELILDSLKSDVSIEKVTPPSAQTTFNVETFDLGHDIPLDRDLIYADRG